MSAGEPFFPGCKGEEEAEANNQGQENIGYDNSKRAVGPAPVKIFRKRVAARGPVSEVQIKGAEAKAKAKPRLRMRIPEVSAMKMSRMI